MIRHIPHIVRPFPTTLVSPRFVFSKLCIEDLPEMFEKFSNPAVSYGTYMPPPEDDKMLRDYILNTGKPGNKEYIFTMRTLDDNRMIGSLEFFFSSPPHEAQVHYSLNEEFWGQGIMVEAVQIVLKWGIRSYPKLMRILSFHSVENLRSTKVMEKCGFYVIGKRFERWHKYPDGIDIIYQQLDTRSAPFL